ncbi:unnamed protein product [Ambrosiozyma monospora]|uniref:Unnamed protein product n=1 Tax=Ambrosiozyma monospora TaxID=43982 RepID=A0ACB5TCY6_AMBMO|nr:unnamed protein product [Ambrosiozyma monospora]
MMSTQAIPSEIDPLSLSDSWTGSRTCPECEMFTPNKKRNIITYQRPQSNTHSQQNNHHHNHRRQHHHQHHKSTSSHRSQSVPSSSSHSFLNTNPGASQHNHRQAFISAQTPISQVHYSSVMKAVSKIFSGETPAFPSYIPLTFGDGKGFTACVTFKLEDRTARGSERIYALLVTSDIEGEMFQHWKYTTVRSRLVSLANTIKSRNYTLTHRPAESSNANNNEIYLRRTSRTPENRGLTEILEDDEIFLKIHTWAVDLLKTIDAL